MFSVPENLHPAHHCFCTGHPGSLRSKPLPKFYEYLEYQSGCPLLRADKALDLPENMLSRPLHLRRPFCSALLHSRYFPGLLSTELRQNWFLLSVIKEP